MDVIEATDTDLSGAFLMIGLPGRGLVAGIAANFLVKELRMTFLAGLQGDELPPAASAVNGVAMSPVHLYVSDAICGLNRSCRRLVILKSDIPLQHPMYFPVARTIIDWAKAKGIAEIAILEGFERDQPAESGGQVKCLKNLYAKVDLDELGIAPCDEGVLTSFGAAVLLKANVAHLPAVCLFAEVAGATADARAAAMLLAKLNPLIPEIDIPLDPLFEKAKAIQDVMEKDRVHHESDMQRIQDSTIMYV